MQQILKYTLTSVIALAAIISLWFLMNNLQPISPGLYSFAVVFVIGVVILFMLFGGKLKNRIVNVTSVIVSTKYFIPIAISLVAMAGILIRTFFYFHFSYTPVSDPITFFEAGQRIADGHGMTGDGYATLFPYLAAYNGLLGLSMAIISDPWLATIILNTLFDIGAAFAVYFTVKQLTKSGSKLPLIAFAAWFLSPFSILFSLISLPIIVVNFFIIITVLLVCIFLNALKRKSVTASLLLASLIGVTISIGNSFRPVFIIALVALLILFLYLIISNKDKLKLSLILTPAYLVILVIFLLAQQLSLVIIAKSTSLDPPSNSSGWSIFVGANWDMDGKWNREDEIRMSQICSDTKNYEECHGKLRDAGIERYKSYGIVDTINLFIRKLYVFSGNQSNVYNANLSIDNYADSRTQKLLNTYLVMYITTLFLLSFLFFYRTSKLVLNNKQISPAILFVALLLIGFFMSAMLVETSERYAQIMYPLFIVAAVLSIATFRTPKSKKQR